MNSNPYKKMTEEQAELYLKSLGIVDIYIRNKNLPKGDPKVIEVLSDCLAVSVINYNKSKGSLITYFESNAKNPYKGLVKYLECKGRSSKTVSFNLDIQDEEISQLNTTFEGEDDRFMRLSANLLSNFSGEDYEILELLIYGYTHKQIAEKMNLSRASVKRKAKRVRLIAREKIEEVGLI